MINWINLNFIKRKCELSKKGLTNPAVDLLYIDLQKRWDSMNPDLSNISKFKKVVVGISMHVNGTRVQN